jgi:hypothetical protein
VALTVGVSIHTPPRSTNRSRSANDVVSSILVPNIIAEHQRGLRSFRHVADPVTWSALPVKPRSGDQRHTV